jgi:predicted NAD/FAD-dependent oxidoreductase
MTRRDGPSVLIVGAGLAGVACGLALDQAGYRVRLVDKGRNPGGRLSTRTSGGSPSLMGEDAPWRFDHGAQYVTAREADFQDALDDLVTRGAASLWTGRFATLSEDSGLEAEENSPARYVGVPGMSQIPGMLAFDLDLALQAEMSPPKRMKDGGWDLGDFGDADILLSTAPAAQTATLLADVPDLAALCATASYAPCLVTMAGLDQKIDLGADGIFVDDAQGLLRWVGVNGSKPDRPQNTTCLTLHASAEWSAQHVNDDKDVLKHGPWRRFREIAKTALGLTLPEPSYLRGHRWLYARANSYAQPTYDTEARAGFAGDWAPPGALGEGRAEDAWRSGRDLAAQVIATAKQF